MGTPLNQFTYSHMNNDLNFLATINQLIRARDSNGILALCGTFNEKFKELIKINKDNEKKLERYVHQINVDKEHIQQLILERGNVKEILDKESNLKVTEWLEHSTLYGEHEKLMREHEQVQQRLHDKEADIERCREFTTIQTMEIEKLENEKLDKEFEINQLMSDLETSEKKLKDEMAKNAELSNEIQKIRGTLDDEVNKNLNIDAKISESQDYYDKVRQGDLNKINQLSKELECSQIELKRAEAKAAELVKEMKKLGTKLNDEVVKSFAAQASFEERKRELEENHRGILEESACHKSEIETERKNVKTVENKNMELRKEIEKLQARIDHEVSQNIEIVKSYKEKKQEFENNRLKLTREINETSTQCTMTERKLEIAEAKNAELMNEIKKLGTKLNDEVVKAAAMREEFGVKIRSLEAMKTDFKSVFEKHFTPGTSNEPPRKKSCLKQP